MAFIDQKTKKIGGVEIEMHSMSNGKADINDDVDSGLIHKENYEAVNNELNELVYSFLFFLIMIGKRKESDEGH